MMARLCRNVLLVNKLFMIICLIGCYGDDILDSSSGKPFRICTIAKSTDLVRFDADFDCAHYNSKAEQEEGIMVVFKSDIVAYTFEVRTYRKELTTQESYRGVYTQYMTSKNVNYYPMPLDEVRLVNKKGKCYSTISMTQTYTNNGNSYNRTFTAFHKDDTKKTEMELFPLEIKTSINKRYITTKIPFINYGYVWTYHTSSSVNCIVTDTKAKTKFPFEFFALSTGETVECSPFFNLTNDKTFNEDLSNFQIYTNYTMLKEIGPDTVPVEKVVPKLAMLTKGDMVYSWEVKDENKEICLLKHWASMKDAIRSKNNKTYHFITKEMTASFVSKHEPINLTDPREACINNTIYSEIYRIYDEEYNETHVMNGSMSLFRTTGDLIVAWQPLTRKSLSELENFLNGTEEEKSSRRKRDLSNVDSKQDILYTQMQYLFDTLREYINNALRQLAESWCLDQKRTIAMLQELSKINPSTIVSLVYGESVSAKWTGDVLSMSKCNLVDQTSVQLQKSMKVEGENGMCYMRPVVTFQYINSTETQYGQLGIDNEILVGKHRIENCEEASTKMFISGDKVYVFKDYVYVNTSLLSSIEVLDAYIGLNIDLMENTDFQVLELYSKEEIAKSNVLDLETVLREYNLHKSALYGMKTGVHDITHSYWSGINDFFSGLGSIGKGIGSAVTAVGGAVADLAKGITGLLTNPFIFIVIIIGAIIVLAIIIVVFKKQNRMYSSPIGNLFPYTGQDNSEFSKSIFDGYYGPAPNYAGNRQVHIKEETNREYTKEDALKILKAIKDLDDSYKEFTKLEKQNIKKPSLVDRIMYRDYKALPTDG
ncbi:envelope glycoprotein B [Murid herpesvirus 3]|uniref:Envelope glycoprotein B n=2 Tax=Murid betaherpesvirus 3 TaxID=2560603 RepID=A0A1P8VIU7_9BETA|nr:envelope glycoprotein B [Murine roseolovirus]APZ76268.1 envelope glycoprotein B [Murid betaherpesvirus 3]AYH64717.1 envelope glycoprotein B [Murid herpesvirus 3]